MYSIPVLSRFFCNPGFNFAIRSKDFSVIAALEHYYWMEHIMLTKIEENINSIKMEIIL